MAMGSLDVSALLVSVWELVCLLAHLCQFVNACRPPICVYCVCLQWACVCVCACVRVWLFGHVCVHLSVSIRLCVFYI